MILLPLLYLQATTQLSLDFTKPGVAVSSTLYGLMTEEINYSYDGGLYGELLRNRAFLDDSRQPAHWSAVGEGASIDLERTGHTAARPVAVRIRGGAANDGYWGIPVRPSTSYRLALWVKADAPGPIHATIESPDRATVYARADVTGVDGAWRKLTATLKTGPVSPTTDARFVLRTGDRTVWIEQASLFQPTYKGRDNDNRPDLMRMLVEMKPKFLRFPGGNYLEGNTLADRFPWKQTLGPIEDRPGHRSPWGYRSTDGMGLLEFLQWSEDMKAKPLLAVYAGYALNGGYIKPGPDLQPVVDDAYDRKGPKVFVGEWASHDTVPPWRAGPSAGPTPNMKCALGDAAFMTGLERNSDVVEMACYAPLLVNVNPGGRQWSLNLIGYDALRCFGSPSYYAQEMFAENLGDRTVPVTLTGEPMQEQSGKSLPGLFASATRDTRSGTVYVKLVNPLPSEQNVAFDLKGYSARSDGTLTVLSGDLKEMNSIDEPTKISPVTTKVRGLGTTFRQTLPAHSVVVLTLRKSTS